MEVSPQGVIISNIIIVIAVANAAYGHNNSRRDI
jgi:hypothetical protein